MSNKSIHQFTVKNIAGESFSLDTYKGKVLLIVNTASKCGLTPQLKGLQELHDKYGPQHFSIVAFPSNDFLKQEPLEGAAIAEFCDINYRTNFPIHDKIVVKKGSQQCELFQFLGNKSKNGVTNRNPLWNFQKYLINQQGEVVQVFSPLRKPTSRKITRAIEKTIAHENS